MGTCYQYNIVRGRLFGDNFYGGGKFSPAVDGTVRPVEIPLQFAQIGCATGREGNKVKRGGNPAKSGDHRLMFLAFDKAQNDRNTTARKATPEGIDQRVHPGGVVADIENVRRLVTSFEDLKPARPVGLLQTVANRFLADGQTEILKQFDSTQHQSGVADLMIAGQS